MADIQAKIEEIFEHHVDAVYTSNTGQLELEQIKGIETIAKTLRLLQGKSTEIVEEAVISKMEKEVAELSDADLDKLLAK